MRMQVLPVADEADRAAALRVTQGRIFDSGRAFAPFAKMSAYEALAATSGSYQPPAPVEPGAPVAVTGAASNWQAIEVGALKLASAGDGSWWPSIVTENKGEDFFVLRWLGYDDEPAFVRRGADLGLMPPSAAADLITADAPTDGAGEPLA